MKSTIRSIALVAAAAAFAAGCVSDEKLITTSSTVSAAATPLLARYVSMGNSITAGMQSAGINDSTQRQAYPVLLARMAGVPFNVPSLAMPGCPPPFTVPLGPTRLGTGSTGSTCFLRNSTFIGLPNNVAVPGEYMADITNPLGTRVNNALNTFINGGLDEAQAMAAVRPTFVTLWAPNNDVLNAANLGDTTLLTPLATYQAGLNAAVAAIKAVPTLQGAALIGAVDVPDYAPIMQPGAYFFAADQAHPNQFGKPVDVSCAPFNQQGQPNPFGDNLVSFQVAADTSVHAISCLQDARYVITKAVFTPATPEYLTFVNRIADINAAIKAAAQANGWIYIDPNLAMLAATSDPSKIRLCQFVRNGASTPATFATNVANSCPAPTAPNFFGSLISYDGTHPSFAFHQALAVLLADSINAKYGTHISTTPPTSAVVAR